MGLLLLFAFLAGVFTMLSPCVLPILPALLSAGTVRDRFRPLGIVIGLVASFTVFTLFISAIVQAIGLSADILRNLAIAVIFLCGLIMLIPSLSDYFAQATAFLGSVGGQQKRPGLLGGLLLGAALGLVWTPCAGPILAAIVTLAATQAVTWSTILLTLAYSIGAAIPMFLIVYGSGRLIESSRLLASKAEGIRRLFGLCMIVMAVAMALHWDQYIQKEILTVVPPVLIEEVPFVKDQLQQVGGGADKYEIGQGLTDYGKAPDLTGIDNWINSPPLTLEKLRGKVVLIDFWTYSCINCLRTLPYIEKWYADYKDRGLVVIGVHTPEFAFEKEPKNVEAAVKRSGVLYPVAQDNEYKTWLAYGNQYWPAHYLIDKDGNLRLAHFGEGGYMEMENAIRKLLGMSELSVYEKKLKKVRSITPETYLGALRGGSNYTMENHLQLEETVHYDYRQALGNDQVGLKGEWKVEGESIVAKGSYSQLDLNFLARKVYLVLSGESDRAIEVAIDGHPAGKIMMNGDRKYDIADVKYGRHKLTLIIPPGVSAYAFTFGDE